MKKTLGFLTSVVALFSISLPMLAPVTVQAQTASGSGACYTFSANLGEGRPISAQQGAALAQDLSNEGFWNANTPITSYTDAVASAVSGFQEKYAAQILTPNGLSYGTGYVGASTRAELNALYGCSTATTTTGGQTFQCPSGWVCTAPTQTQTTTFSCPTGWICTQATNTVSPANPISPVNTSTYSGGCPTGTSWNGLFCSVVNTSTPVTTTYINPIITNTNSTGSLNVGAQDQLVTFTRSFFYNGSSPVTLSILADNGFSASVNGVQVAVDNNNNNYGSVNSYNISSNLVQGNNTLSITVDNQWQPDPDNGFSWQWNPGGLDYAITSNGSTLVASGNGDQASYNGSASSALVIPSNALGGAWITIPGTSWIWDTALYNEYSGNNVTTNANHAPVISGINGPTTLSVGQTGTWNLLASDPQNGSLNYSVNWGDNAAIPTALAAGINQSTSLQHTYYTAGTYTITFTVTDSAGLSTTDTTTVVVGKAVTSNSNSATISLDPTSPLAGTMPVTNPTTGAYLGLPVLVFDVNAQGDTLHLHSVSVNVTSSGNGAVTAAYLYQGSTPIAFGSVVNGVATFANILDGTAGASIPVNTTVPFTVKVDVTGVTAGGSESVTAGLSSGSQTIYSSIDGLVPVSGSANGNTQTVANGSNVTTNSQATFSLAATPAITKQNITPGAATTSTLMYTATFNVNVQAVGGSVNLGLPSSVAAAFGSASTPASLAQLYVNGGQATNNNGIQITASYSQPSNTVLSSDGSYFTIGQNQSVTIPVTYTWTVANPGASTYALQLQGIQWFTSSNGSGATVNSSMANQTNWRTPAI